MFRINLLPENIKDKFNQDKFYSILIITSIVILSLQILNIGFDIVQSISIKNKMKDYSAALEKNKNIKNQVLLNGNFLNSQIRRYNSYISAYNSRSSFSMDLIKLIKTFPGNLWFDSVEFYEKENESVFEVKGTTVNTQSVTEFMKNIRTNFINHTKLKLKSSESFKSGGRDFLKFEIYLSLGKSNGK